MTQNTLHSPIIHFKSEWIRNVTTNDLTPTEVYVFTSLQLNILPYNWVVLSPSNVDKMQVDLKTYNSAIARLQQVEFLFPIRELITITPRQLEDLAQLYTIATDRPWEPASEIYQIHPAICWSGEEEYQFFYPEGLLPIPRTTTEMEEAKDYPSILNFETSLRSLLIPNYTSDLIQRFRAL